ncbi:alpha/beta hydrolase [Methylobacterium sp. J-077]|uniref:alpha/beta hydrolase n=1 Tax=Methylobacterium sp. J-077 TaxID=2836656 RepID=UPI001FB9AE56|nr:alpha/beta hydrolase [Methylobacterium sp. J-077]MCJ2127092.1 alpha/beta hydrolase [Methylobacterium sp. J-077]
MTQEILTPNSLGLIHRFEPGAPAARPLLLLHGTGGTEHDLLPLGRIVAPGAALLSPRGAVSENGMPRFFRRLAEGVFDEADLRRRTQDLATFVGAARARYGIGAPLALGFSNGANIAAALLMLHPEVLAGAVLIRPMVPLAEPPAAALAGKPVLMLSGAMDPIVPAENASRLAQQLTTVGAAVEHRILPVGHGLSQADVGLAADWVRSLAHADAA